VSERVSVCVSVCVCVCVCELRGDGCGGEGTPLIPKLVIASTCSGVEWSGLIQRCLQYQINKFGDLYSVFRAALGAESRVC
jgi:hypothetical protein